LESQVALPQALLWKTDYCRRGGCSAGKIGRWMWAAPHAVQLRTGCPAGRHADAAAGGLCLFALAPSFEVLMELVTSTIVLYGSISAAEGI